MFKLMREAKNDGYTKRDILRLNEFDHVKKYEVEKSRSYIGYKLLW